MTTQNTNSSIQCPTCRKRKSSVTGKKSPRMAPPNCGHCLRQALEFAEDAARNGKVYQAVWGLIRAKESAPSQWWDKLERVRVLYQRNPDWQIIASIILKISDS